jgi:glycerol-3-phosphate O-acyltransferase
MAMCATCLLAAPKHSICQNELEQAIDHFLALLKAAPYSHLASIPGISGKELLAQTLERKKLTLSEDSYGKIVSPKNQNAVALTYYRNNIQHLFALPSLMSAITFANKGVTKNTLLNLAKQLYPLLKQELFIYMNSQQAEQYCQSIVNSMQSMNLINIQEDRVYPPTPASSTFYSAWLLSRGIQETLHRYAVVLTILSKQTQINRKDLEQQSRQFAERLSTLHGLSSPEFFDKNVLSSFITALKDMQVIQANDQGQLNSTDKSEILREQVIELIDLEIAQRLQHI